MQWSTNYSDGSGNRRYDLTSLGVSWGSEPTLALHCYSTIAVALWQRHWKSLLSWRWTPKTGRGCPTFWSSLYCRFFFTRNWRLYSIQAVSKDLTCRQFGSFFCGLLPNYPNISGNSPQEFEQVIEIQVPPMPPPPGNTASLRFAMTETPQKKKIQLPSLCDATTKASLILEAQCQTLWKPYEQMES